jgi:hypothetical protein
MGGYPGLICHCRGHVLIVGFSNQIRYQPPNSFRKVTASATASLRQNELEKFVENA